MMFSVPQFIDVEDKIAGPLTWKQLLWMIGLGAILLILFKTFDTALFIIVAIPTVLLFAAFAFYKPNGFPLTTFVFYAVLFLFRPKVAVWERTVERKPEVKEPEKKVEETFETKQMDTDKLHELARLLDNQKGN
ncbi:MAG: PrgI family protein [Candidatus Moraniibacteriota bacterium]